MAPQTRASRRRTKASTPHPSVETASNHVRNPSSGDSLNGNTEPKSISHEADRHPIAETETETPQVLAYVGGIEMFIPQTYDPDTYYPDRRMPWTPEPEPYSPETYTAWGRKHFGEEWYKLRQTMIEERNIFLEYDPVYHERQRTLRIIEHKIERRPFKPINIFNRDWKRLWARLSKEWGIEIVRSPTPQKNSDDSDTDLSGYDTYAPTPEYRTPTPPPDDPWEKLEYERKRFNWNEERYEFEKIFLKENLKDRARCLYENEPGDKPAHEKRQLMESFRDKDPLRFRIEQDRFQAHIDLQRKGWTTEQIEALYNATVSMHEWIKGNSARSKMRSYLAENLGKPTPEQQAARSSWWDKIRDATIEYYGACPRKGWDSFGFSIYDFLVGVTTTMSYEEKEEEEIWRQNTHARLCSRRQQEALASTKGDAQATEKAPKPSPRQTAKALHGTRGGRITKEAPTHAKASPPDPRRRRPKPEAVGELGNSTRTASQIHKRQPKTYKKERSSRRLAGKAPEYGMLGEGEIPYSLRKPSNTRPTSRSSLRGGKKSKGEREARSVKPRETLKSRKSRRAG